MGILIIADSLLELGIAIAVRMITPVILMKTLDGQIAVVGQVRHIVGNQAVEDFPGVCGHRGGFRGLEEHLEVFLSHAASVCIGQIPLISRFLVLGKNTTTHVQLLADLAVWDACRQHLKCSF